MSLHDGGLIWTRPSHSFWRGISPPLLTSTFQCSTLILSHEDTQLLAAAMLTGIETAGLVLAVLPLIVKSLSQYADGIETLSLFRSGKYPRQLRDWAISLETQSVILENTLTELLIRCIDDDETIALMYQDHQHQQWKDPKTELKMRNCLGRSYEPYMRTMESLCDLLQTMEARLGLSARAETNVSEVLST